MLYETNNIDCNYIIELMNKIDKIQKDVLQMGDNVCLGCEIALLSSASNTVPISIYVDSSEAFNALVDLTGTTTNIFRIESIKCNKYVTLRLLEVSTDVPPAIVGTNRTIVVDITKIIGIQCYEPITIEPCTSTT